MHIPRFVLGHIVITRAASDIIHPQDVKLCLQRHACGDWGDLDEGARQSNQIGLEQGLDLLSAHVDRAGVRFWIISRADRSTTDVVLPDDYRGSPHPSTMPEVARTFPTCAGMLFRKIRRLPDPVRSI